MIGRCQLVTDGATIDLSVSAQRLLGLLGLRGYAMTRLAVAGALWPERTEDRALGNLRAALWRLGDAKRGVLRVADEAVELREQVRVDLRTLRARCLAALRCGRISDDLGTDDRLVCDLCDTFDGSWAETEVERWRQLRLHTLVRYAEQLEERGDHSRSRAVIERARIGAPHHESLQHAPARVTRGRPSSVPNNHGCSPEPLNCTTVHHRGVRHARP